MNDLIISNMNTALAVKKPEYNLMLKNIQDRMPAVVRDTSNFHKSHSQFMQVTLDVTAITPIRSIKHTLAEIDRTRGALQEAYINLRKKQNDLKKKERELASCTDDLDRELLAALASLEQAAGQAGLGASLGKVVGEGMGAIVEAADELAAAHLTPLR